MPEGRKCNICHFEKIDFKDFEEFRITLILTQCISSPYI